jgi:hypothetical protein
MQFLGAMIGQDLCQINPQGRLIIPCARPDEAHFAANNDLTETPLPQPWEWAQAFDKNELEGLGADGKPVKSHSGKAMNIKYIPNKAIGNFEWSNCAAVKTVDIPLSVGRLM